MANSQLGAAFLAAVLVLGGCGARHSGPRSSITVKLPPAHAATAAPGFSFGSLGKPRQSQPS